MYHKLQLRTNLIKIIEDIYDLFNKINLMFIYLKALFILYYIKIN